ncbi:serine hydrolase domain-containing protein [Methylovirgula sp. 4M-Z18]|uniref:serine hydrolase domain-containing protein n=1 Tax=Methylovirgula sp. 4M-Z18 TaxID=2293567 RepID=UPI001314A658|nr:serine hydrolase domain-containing protein [Methylovirgula sp. 4M-Z18]
MQRRQVMMAFAGIALGAAAAREAIGQEATEAREDIAGTLRPYLASHNLPALAAAVVRGGVTVATGAVGTRRVATDAPVAINDRFHIGSDTKAMTALAAAILVEAGKLRWEATLGETFPDLAARLHPTLGGVTLEQLLSHTSGIPTDDEAIAKLLEQSYAQQDLNLDELRLWLLAQWAGQEPQTKPGTQFAYSNLGYTFAGAMIERAGRATWEEIVAASVFGPLGLRSAGFGPQASLGRIDAPLGHLPRDDGTLKAMLAGPDGDVPPIYGPAGTVHLSVLDFAAWASWNAGEGKRGPALVRPETLRRLHTPVISMDRPHAPPGTPPSGSYGLGWGTTSLPFSSEDFIFHGGSNGMNLAYIMMQPERDFAMVLMTNVGGTKADEALKALAGELYGRFKPAR